MADRALRALACCSDPAVLSAAAAAGWTLVRAGEDDEALARARHDTWDLVLVDDTTGSATRDYLRGLGGPRRRGMFLVQVAAHHATGDRFDAWAASADLVVHPADAARIGALVQGGRAEKAAFTERFRAVLGEPGARLGAHA